MFASIFLPALIPQILSNANVIGARVSIEPLNKKRHLMEPSSSLQLNTPSWSLWHGQGSATQTIESPLSIEAHFLGYDAQFVHPPLLRCEKSVRLLELFWSPNTCGFIQCGLESVDLKNCRQYKALSYTWYNPFLEDEGESCVPDWRSPTQRILCNGKSLYVRQDSLR